MRFDVILVRRIRKFATVTIYRIIDTIDTDVWCHIDDVTTTSKFQTVGRIGGGRHERHSCAWSGFRSDNFSDGISFLASRQREKAIVFLH